MPAKIGFFSLFCYEQNKRLLTKFEKVRHGSCTLTTFSYDRVYRNKVELKVLIF